MLQVVKTFFDKKIKLIKIKNFKDKRGYFAETYNKKNYFKIGIKDNFVQDNQSLSITKGTIRGLHFQSPQFHQAKLVSVFRGSIQDIIVDLRKNSITYGKYISIIMKENDFKQIYIPSGFAHGFCALKSNTIINYKASNFYSKNHEHSLLWNDKKLSINWKISKNPIISKKDAKGIKFHDFKSPF